MDTGDGRASKKKMGDLWGLWGDIQGFTIFISSRSVVYAFHISAYIFPQLNHLNTPSTTSSWRKNHERSRRLIKLALY